MNNYIGLLIPIIYTLKLNKFQSKSVTFKL